MEVRIINRMTLNTPTIDEPDRQVYSIQYQVGELPPGFVHLPVKGYTKEKEAAAIKKHFEARQQAKSETITLPG